MAVSAIAEMDKSPPEHPNVLGKTTGQRQQEPTPTVPTLMHKALYLSRNPPPPHHDTCP